MVGFLGARGPEDELYIRTVLNTAAREHTGVKVLPRLCIMDARPYASAVANGYNGGGRENPEHYLNASISYMSLGNIHVIASSHQALLKAVSTHSESSNWYTQIESTGWLSHVADLLKASTGRDGVVGKMVESSSSVLVHCTDGWDRTTQMVSLAQVVLDPYYRTIRGLRVIIEKEWLACGHPFQSRTDAVPNNNHKKTTQSPIMEDESWRASSGPGVIHSSPNGAREAISSLWLGPSSPPTSSAADAYHPSLSTRQAASPAASTTSPSPIPVAPSPVFLLFMTCLHHIVQQHPSQFEYNDYLLMVLARAVSGFSPFGDFLCNNERERALEGLRERTASIWSWIEENSGWFTNRDYERYFENHHQQQQQQQRLHGGAWRDRVLKIQTGGRFTTLWTEFYLNTPPDWFPDPRTALSTASFYACCRSVEPLQRMVRQAVLAMDPLYASQFDSEQLQQLAFPGLYSTLKSCQIHSHLYHHFRHQLSFSKMMSKNKTVATSTIPPALAIVRGQDMHIYYLLVQYLKDRRKRLVQQAMENWRGWAKRKLEERVAKDAGWVVGGISGHGSSQDDEEEEEGGDDDDDETEELEGHGDGEQDSRLETCGEGQGRYRQEQEGNGQRRSRPKPKLRIVEAKKGIEVTMRRILEERTFFSATAIGGLLAFEDQTESEDEHNDAQLEGQCGDTNQQGKDEEDQVIDVAVLELQEDDGLEEAFDDFGFPVAQDDQEVFVAV
ncbi:hypothetical protein EDD11_004735 [Mortierella claussenii]|nr:hypothetical protein EDD11_004735 [Mortierella claussenii]